MELPSKNLLEVTKMKLCSYIISFVKKSQLIHAFLTVSKLNGKSCLVMEYTPSVLCT
jgi:hypothetical protein